MSRLKPSFSKALEQDRERELVVYQAVKNQIKKLLKDSKSPVCFVLLSVHYFSLISRHADPTFVSKFNPVNGEVEYYWDDIRILQCLERMIVKAVY